MIPLHYNSSTLFRHHCKIFLDFDFDTGSKHVEQFQDRIQNVNALKESAWLTKDFLNVKQISTDPEMAAHVWSQHHGQ